MVDEPALVLSPATLADSALLLALRNHSETRRWSFGANEIPPGEHEVWLREILSGVTTRLFIATERGLVVGFGQIDLLSPSGREGELSVIIHWDHLGRGIGTAFIEALCREAGHLKVKVCVAHIKETNTGSRIAFGRAAFVIESLQDGIVTMLRRL